MVYKLQDQRNNRLCSKCFYKFSFTQKDSPEENKENDDGNDEVDTFQNSEIQVTKQSEVMLNPPKKRKRGRPTKLSPEEVVKYALTASAEKSD